MGLLALAAWAIVLVWGQVNDGLCVAVIGACHDGNVRCARRLTASNPQRQVVCLRARIDKICDLRIVTCSNEIAGDAATLSSNTRETKGAYDS